MNIEILKEQIKRHEGEVLEVYEDSLGYLTLGVGHLIREDDEEFGEPAGTPVSPSHVGTWSNPTCLSFNAFFKIKELKYFTSTTAPIF